MRVVIAGSTPKSLVRFRGRLIGRIAAAGHEVVALAAHRDRAFETELSALGARSGTFPVQRRGLNPFRDLGTCLALRRRFRRERAELVFAYTAKPVVWGGIAARLAGVPRFHAMLTGLGGLFSGDSPRRRLAARALGALYRGALRRADSVIFQNADDRETFVARGIVARERTRLVHGSGVDLGFYARRPLPPGPPTFACAARLIGSKGLREYAAAARVVRAEFPEVRFRLAGRFEEGGDALSSAELERWREEGAVDFVGELPDTRELLAGCHVFVLPSYYGEGLPRTLLEALAVGRPVLTCDSVGCRDVVVPGVGEAGVGEDGNGGPGGVRGNGRLVPPRDVDALVAALRWFLAHRDAWEAMAGRSHALARERYDVDAVNRAMLDILGLGPDRA